MKGGPIPFSEIGDIADQTQYLLKQSISPLTDPSISAPNNPTNSNVNPNVTKQFIRTNNYKFDSKSPNIMRFFNVAFSPSARASP